MTDHARTEQVGGSFRDPSNRVYTISADKAGTPPRILRGLGAATTGYCQQLLEAPFFKRLIEEKRIVATRFVDASDPAAKSIIDKGWDNVLEHDAIPFISYPYEWSFSMLRTAALLHLRIMEDALNEGWMVKDATPFNIQFVGRNPIFIDIPSLEPWTEGEPWVAYRQFCACFLTPLMLRAYLGIDHLPLMRSYIDGIPATEAVKFFRGAAKFRPGVMSHIVFPAAVERRIEASERDDAEAKSRTGKPQSKTMILGLVQSMTRLVKSLRFKLDHTDWSDYDQTHSYDDAEHQSKKAFVEKAATSSGAAVIWDIGCNTGTFSRLTAPHAKQVIALDGDHNAIEKLYLHKDPDTADKILPLVMNLANISPSQGWAGQERLAFDQRGKPDLVLSLALIHHIRMSANIPIDMYLDWLRSLDSDIVLEFVDRHDEMVIKLLTNKAEQYEDYNLDNFIAQVEQRFTIVTREPLKDGKRQIFHLSPA